MLASIAGNLGALPSYDFVAPQRMAFGWGRRRELGDMAARLGSRALCVIGSRSLQKNGVVSELLESLRAAGVESAHVADVHREPEVDDVDRATQAIHELGLQPGDFVLALGGGSAIDLGKAVAAMATNRAASVADFLEGVGRGLQISIPPLPMLAMPTTAGTGSEATKNAVISSRRPAYKKSLRADAMMPRVALVDPELTVGLPAGSTAFTGMDAITQLIESFISLRRKPIAQALAVHGLRLALPAIEVAVRDGECRPAREAMAHAALLSGLALANSGLGLAHGVAAALGAVLQVPHGLACAVMLPLALQANRAASQAQLAELERAVGDCGVRDDQAAAEAFVARITALCRRIGIPDNLRELGVTREMLPALVDQSQGNSMSANPRAVSQQELANRLEAML